MDFVPNICRAPTATNTARAEHLASVRGPAPRLISLDFLGAGLYYLEFERKIKYSFLEMSHSLNLVVYPFAQAHL